MNLKTWRKIHIYAFGYLKSVSLVVSVFFVVMFITGILLAHRHSFRFLATVKVPLVVLPQAYTDRVDRLNDAQSAIPGAHLDGAPLDWVVRDLHTGKFLGTYGVYIYDVLTLALVVLSVTGIYLYIKIGLRRDKATRQRRTK